MPLVESEVLYQEKRVVLVRERIQEQLAIQEADRLNKVTGRKQGQTVHSRSEAID